MRESEKKTSNQVTTANNKRDYTLNSATMANKIRLIVLVMGILVVVIAAKLVPATKKSVALWQESAIGLADIAAFNCNKPGDQCAAVSANGQVMISRGNNWERITPLTLEDGELINALVIDEAGKIVVGTGVDQSRWTSLYQLNATQWTKQTGNYGGIGGYSSNDEIMVGGGGLFYTSSSGWQQIPGCQNATLYAAASNAVETLVVGDYSIAGSQRISSAHEDQGWVVTFLKENNEHQLTGVNSSNQATPNNPVGSDVQASNQSANGAFYSVAIAGNLENSVAHSNVLIGGSAGKLYRRNNEGWFYQNVGLEKEVLAAYLDEQGNEGFIGGHAGIAQGFIMHTANGGASWQPAKLVSHRRFGPIIKIVRAKNKLLAASSNGQVYEYLIQSKAMNQ
jgi:hypothetical protein